MDDKRIQAIKKSIGLGIKTEQEAYEVISLLVREDWSWWIENTDPRIRWTEKPCIVCGVMYLCGNGPASGLCEKCYRTDMYEVSKLSVHRSRARDAGLPYTLTLREWYATISDFNGMCAYCLKHATALEHFIPIVLGGGTVKWNCVPACSKCNNIKKSHHPDEVKDRLPSNAVERVHSYLQQFK